ncbi:MAG: DNA primase [Candidatus Omnitrophica bacterium]|nr:DNA primase [Candidatus Omnitrophota bacterium]
MGGRIPQNIIEDILSRVDIVELISGYIPLKRAGRNFRALCPFHHEKTPSFMISPDRQIYHCFGCGAGGNAFSFLMQYERMEFLEAAEFLAKKAGVSLPKAETQDSRAQGLVTQLYMINELAASYYESNLNSSLAKAVKNYLFNRGLNEESLRLFKLGFAQDRWDGLINHLRAKNVSLGSLEKAGLALTRQEGGFYDRFRNRIITPIFDIKSRVIAFGARQLSSDKTQAKYINSPETPVYTKGKNLYGLNFSKDAVRQSDCCLVVEGYFDFILPYQAGIHNIVASLGTALTLEQAKLIKRYTHNVVVVFDPDSAGEIAALRSLDIFIEEAMNVRVATLPSGFDPDSFVRKYGKDEFMARVSGADDLFDFKLKILKSRYNSKEIEAKAKISSAMLETIAKFRHEVLKSEYIKRLSEEIGVGEEALLKELSKKSEPKKYQLTEAPAGAKPVSLNPTERLLIKLMLEETNVIEEIKQSLDPADFQEEGLSSIVSILFDLVSQGKQVETNSLINYFSDERIKQIICESSLSAEVTSSNRQEVLNDCIQRLKDQRLKHRRQRLHDEIKAAQNLGDEDEMSRLILEFNRLIKPLP